MGLKCLTLPSFGGPGAFAAKATAPPVNELAAKMPVGITPLEVVPLELLVLLQIQEEGVALDKVHLIGFGGNIYFELFTAPNRCWPTIGLASAGPPAEVLFRMQAALAQGAELPPFIWPSTGEQLHVAPVPLVADDRSLLCDNPLLCWASPPLSRCECGCLSLVFSRRWPLLPRLVVAVAAVAAACSWAAVTAEADAADAEEADSDDEEEDVEDPVADEPPEPLPEARFCWALREFLPLELLVELLLSSAPEIRPLPAAAPFCMSAFTISCLASDVLVPGLVRLIFILSDW